MISLVLTILFAVTTNATNIEIVTLKKDSVIKKGQVAGFQGVLVPEYNYRNYTKAMETMPLCEDYMSQSIEEHGPFDLAIYIVSGAVVGLIVGMQIK